MRLKPEEAAHWYQRGEAFGRLNRWDRAAADFAFAVQLRADPGTASGLAALVALHAGDAPAYKAACLALAAKPTTDARAAWACVLGLESPLDPTQLVAMAGADPLAGPLALVRAGRAEEALAKLSPTDERPAALLVRALALAKLGKPADAKPLRAKAEAWLAAATRAGAVPPAWDERAAVEILLRELK